MNKKLVSILGISLTTLIASNCNAEHIDYKKGLLNAKRGKKGLNISCIIENYIIGTKEANLSIYEPIKNKIFFILTLKDDYSLLQFQDLNGDFIIEPEKDKVCYQELQPEKTGLEEVNIKDKTGKKVFYKFMNDIYQKSMDCMGAALFYKNFLKKGEEIEIEEIEKDLTYT